MDFNSLINSIDLAADSFRKSAVSSVNIHVSLRNWLIGYYIVEYEQNGEDRAEYGTGILEKLSRKLKHQRGLSLRSLKIFRKFYLTYPGIGQTPSAQFEFRKLMEEGTLFEYDALPSIDLLTKGSGSGKNELIRHTKSTYKKGQTASAQFEREDISLPFDKILKNLSFSHLVELVQIEDPLKRAFYEIEAIKSTWSVRELKRQINSLLFERMGLSKDKDKLMKIVSEKTELLEPMHLMRDPNVFEFLGLEQKEFMPESSLEKALINHMQEFILELGEGFCFEARQKRILIGSDYYFIDLVFYHRIIKCHVLIELKAEKFDHAHMSQLNTYLNYYRKNYMTGGDRPPVGILLCTSKDEELVEYASFGIDNEIFVNEYMLHLPSRKQLVEFIKSEKEKF